MHRRSGVAKITHDGNLSRKTRSDTLASDRRDVEDHPLSKYDRVYNYQTKSTIRRENRARVATGRYKRIYIRYLTRANKGARPPECSP